MNKSRPNKVTVRLSDSELSDLKDRIKLSGFNQQQFLSRAIFNKAMMNKEQLHSLLVELRREGVNLNQIARACNTYKVLDDEQRIKQTIEKLEALWLCLR
ncbi:MAG: plasmid mobilization relaxosome protein MobC [Treponema sp.]|nr:plasmid mobilization relaxosome protein MobC [Treponema sp.]